MAFTKGQNLSLQIGGEEYNGHLSNARLEPDDGSDADFVTFADYSTGDTEQWFMRGTGYQDFAASSLWTYAWLNSGSEVPYVLAPYGNAAPTADKPHFTGTVRISRKPSVGGKVGDAFEFELEWECTSSPTRLVA